MPAFLSLWAGRWELEESYLLIARCQACLLLDGWWLPPGRRTLSSNASLQPFQLAWVESAKQLCQKLGQFLYECSAWDGPKADIKLDATLLGHFSSVMCFQVIILLFSHFLLGTCKEFCRSVIVAVIQSCCFQSWTGLAVGRRMRNEFS